MKQTFPSNRISTMYFFRSSLPIVVNVSPSKTVPFDRPTPTILRRTSSNIESRLSSLQTIHTTFFKELIHHYGTNNVSSVTQCVLDLTLIVSVHASIDYLRNLIEIPSEKYREKYQQIIDPLKWTINDQDKFRMTNVSSRIYQPDILTFYQTIKTNRANIRNAQSLMIVVCSISIFLILIFFFCFSDENFDQQFCFNQFCQTEISNNIDSVEDRTFNRSFTETAGPFYTCD